MKYKITRTHLLLALIILIGAFLRFYKLDWGQGLFTHPDEYHIVTSVNQLSFPDQINPNFFSYGTVSIYLIYFTKTVLSFVFSQLYAIPFTLNAFLLGRFYSAFFSTLTIPLVYGISRTLLNSRYSLLAASLAALTPGLIQQAHFATPESALIFFIFGSLFFLLKFTTNNEQPFDFAQGRRTTNFLLASIFLGLALGVKVSSAIFLPVLLLSLIFTCYRSPFTLLKYSFLSLTATAATFFIVDPYVFLDFTHFWSSFIYESSLARGDFPVFYTRQFIDTTPVIFQLTKILPYTLGPALLISGLLGLFLMVLQLFKKGPSFTFHFLLITSFLSLFLFNGFLFAKWTRFSAPTFPFFAIFSAFLLYKSSQLKIHKFFPYILNTTYLILISLWVLAFFSVYLTPDVRHTASRWVESSAPPGSTFLVEGGNMIDVPLQGNFKKLSLDFYNLENDAQARQKVVEGLTSADFFIIESRRVFANHQRLPNQFPKTTNFYNALFSGKVGFTEVKNFTSYPSLSLQALSFEIPDENAEETWSVFDHPVIRVFQKRAKLTKDEYVRLFEN